MLLDWAFRFLECRIYNRITERPLPPAPLQAQWFSLFIRVARSHESLQAATAALADHGADDSLALLRVIASFERKSG